MLSGIKVLDLTNVLAGPFCCHQLAHMGAEVIKIETVGRGDLARQLGASKNLSSQLMGISFLAQNAGKKSLTINLKSQKGKEIFLKLVKVSDVVVENFRPGVMKRLGLEYDCLKKVNSKLIYCSISGFGQTGPMSKRPAYDQIIQGLSGLMSITGRDGDGPLRVGSPLADTVGGLTAAMAISAALNKRPRGQAIDVAMLDSLLTTMGWVVSNYLIGGVIPTQQGNENMTSAPSGTFQTGDGLLNISANEEKQWKALVHHLGCEHLSNDKRFITRDNRKKYRKELKIELEKFLSKKTAIKWEEELIEIGVPTGIVMSVPNILAHPQIIHRDLLETFDTKNHHNQKITVMRTGFRVNNEPTNVNSPPPSIGEHNNEILSELGYTEYEISEFKKTKVI